MDPSGLTEAVEHFAQSTVNWPDSELEREWAWRRYDDGVRHVWFRTLEELRELAIDIVEERRARGLAPTIAQRVLAQYHYAFRDLEAILLGVSDIDGSRRPTPDDWPLTHVVVHIMASERQFFARMMYAVERMRTGDRGSLAMADDAYRAFYASDRSIEELHEQPLSVVLAHYQALHARVLGALAHVGNLEVDAPSIWWEEEEMSVRFRMHRLESHLRQHAVHAEKTLVDLAIQPTEAKRLSRLLYGALAEVEGNVIGVGELGEVARRTMAANLSARFAEIGAA